MKIKRINGNRREPKPGKYISKATAKPKAQGTSPKRGVERFLRAREYRAPAASILQIEQGSRATIESQQYGCLNKDLRNDTS